METRASGMLWCDAISSHARKQFLQRDWILNRQHEWMARASGAFRAFVSSEISTEPSSSPCRNSDEMLKKFYEKTRGQETGHRIPACTTAVRWCNQ